MGSMLPPQKKTIKGRQLAVSILICIENHPGCAEESELGSEQIRMNFIRWQKCVQTINSDGLIWNVSSVIFSGKITFHFLRKSLHPGRTERHGCGPVDSGCPVTSGTMKFELGVKIRIVNRSHVMMRWAAMVDCRSATFEGIKRLSPRKIKLPV